MSSAEAFSGSRVIATDGMIGRVVDLLFDEVKWTVRYLVVNAGEWLPRNRVLISPYAVRFVDTGSRLIVSSATRSKVAGSPRMDGSSRITRQQEWDYCAYFGYSAPMPIAPDVTLRSFRAVSGFLVRGAGEPLGRVDDLLFDEGSWIIQRIVISAGRWFEGKRFEIAPERLHTVSWNERCLVLGVRRADIRRGCTRRRVASRDS
jgi:uncharacterized protein YrrD